MTQFLTLVTLQKVEKNACNRRRVCLQQNLLLQLSQSLAAAGDKHHQLQGVYHQQLLGINQQIIFSRWLVVATPS